MKTKCSRKLWAHLGKQAGLFDQAFPPGPGVSTQPMIQPVSLNWTLFTTTYDEAEELLKEKLNPEDLLKEIEERK